MPLAGSPFLIQVQRRQPAVRTHFREILRADVRARRAGAAGSGSARKDN